MNAYVGKLRAAMESENGVLLADTVSLLKCNFVPTENVNQARNYMSGPMLEVAVALLNARMALARKKCVEAYEAQLEAIVKFQEICRSNGKWIMHALHVLTHDTRIIAMMADRNHPKGPGHDADHYLRDAEQRLKKGFSLAINDRTQGAASKKPGTLYIVNQLFKIYFKLNTIRLCRNLIVAIEGPSFPDFRVFSKRDGVTYKFYVGRIAMFEDDYDKAEKCLDFAAKHCHRSYRHNKRLILQYLIPVKMLLGHMPTSALLAYYDLDEYRQLSDAIIAGNIGDFNKTIEQHRDQFVMQGIYLIIEKLRIVVYRNLFKKVYLVVNSNQVKFDDFATALGMVTGGSVSVPEIECILSNLIFNAYIKGYLSHQRSTLVLSKKDPFPTLVKSN